MPFFSFLNLNFYQYIYTGVRVLEVDVLGVLVIRMRTPAASYHPLRSSVTVNLDTLVVCANTQVLHIYFVFVC